LLGEEQGVGTDLFAVAGIVIFALTGRVPFHGDSGRAILAAQLAGRVHLDDLQPALAEWLRRALSPDPARRFTDAVAMRAAWRVVVRAVLREERRAASGFWRFLRRLFALARGRSPTT
jgi:serine/threonine-protein kinase